MIFDDHVSAFREKRNEGKGYLHNSRHATAGREHLAPVSLLAPRDRPSTVGLAISCASLHRRLLLLLLQRGRDECSVRGQGSGYLSWSRCCISMWTRCQRARKRRNVRFFQHHPVCQSGRLEALIHAQGIVRGNRSLFKESVKETHDGWKRSEELTSFNPNWWGENSTQRTVPFASANTARLTQRVPGPLAAADAPFVWGCSLLSVGVSSHIFTVRSNDELARTEPNSGCAHESFVTAAS